MRDIIADLLEAVAAAPVRAEAVGAAAEDAADAGEAALLLLRGHADCECEPPCDLLRGFGREPAGIILWLANE